MTMLQAFVQVVLVALVLCKQHTILNRMVKAAQLKLSGFLVCKKLRIVIRLIGQKVCVKTLITLVNI